jgi:BNR-Asp box repeat
MNPRLFIATRKGLFTAERGHTSWGITGTAFLGEPVSMVLPDRADERLYAALNLGHFGVHLHRSDDGGSVWKEVGVPTYPKEEGGDPPSLKLLWALESAGDERRRGLWAGTIPGGLFRSSDRGESWELVRSLWDRPERSQWFGGGYDQPGIHSICVDPQNPDRVGVGVSCGGYWVTEDDGKTWELRATGMVAAYMPPERREDPVIQDPHRVVAAPGNPDVLWCQHHNGVFRSTDAGRRWTEITTVSPSVFGFAVAAHPSDPDTAWFVPAVKDECRIPVDGKVSVACTRDGGKTFEELRSGLPQEHAYDLVYRHGLDVEDDGDLLAMGSTTGSVWISEDGGEHWTALSTHLPPVYAVRFEK